MNQWYSRKKKILQKIPVFEVLSETILITLVEASSSDKIASGVPKFSDEPYSIFCETSHVKVRAPYETKNKSSQLGFCLNYLLTLPQCLPYKIRLKYKLNFKNTYIEISFPNEPRNILRMTTVRK